MNKSKRRLIALISVFSILVNSISFWSPLLVLAQETPEPTPVVEMTPEPTVEPTAEPTVEPTSDAQTNYNTPIPEVTIVPSPSDSFQKEDQLNQTPIPGPSPLADYEPLPSATPFAGLANEPVEKVCLSQGEEIKDTVNEDWEINFEEGWAKTKEPVKLGIKYLFPQENKVSVTFKCLPKEGTTQLKIQKVKVSDLKLPEGVNPYGEYAYDITTGMTDGTFEYDMTLPKPEDKSAKVSYMEQPNGEVKEIEEGKLNQEGDKVKVEGIDHFTIFIATYSDNTFSIDKYQYARGETVYIKAGDLEKDYYYQIKIDPPSGSSSVVGSCSQRDENNELKATYTLPSDATLGTNWKAKLYSYTKSGCNSHEDREAETSFEVIASVQNNWNEPLCKYDPKGDKDPSEIDLYGLTYSAAFYKEEGGRTLFRERVVGNPLNSHDKFKESSWVVLFQNPTSEYYQYLLAVTGKGGGDDTVELWKNTNETEKVKWSPIFGDKPEDKILEKKVKDGYARAYPDGNGNWFVEWGIETSELTNRGINLSTWHLYFATSQDPNNFNKDHLNCYEAPTPTPTETPTPAPYCGDGVKNGNEECDGTAGVTPGQNFCTAQCKLVPIYDGEHQCPAGTVKSQNPVVTKLIHSEDPDGETFSLTSGGKYLFEVSGTFRPTSPSGWYADAGYTTDNNWSSLRSEYGIHGTGNDYAAHALLADLGSGVGVVDWGNYNPDHIYTKYYSPTKSNVSL